MNLVRFAACGWAGNLRASVFRSQIARCGAQFQLGYNFADVDYFIPDTLFFRLPHDFEEVEEEHYNAAGKQGQNQSPCRRGELCNAGCYFSTFARTMFTLVPACPVVMRTVIS